MMLPHVYQSLGLFRSAESRFYDRTGLAYEGYDRAVGRLTGVDIEDFDPLDGGDGCGDAVYYLAVASFAVVGDAFDYLFHCCCLFSLFLSELDPEVLDHVIYHRIHVVRMRPAPFLAGADVIHAVGP